MWPLVAVAAVSAVYNATSASSAAKANAKSVRVTADNNAKMAVDVAKANVVQRQATTKLNNEMTLEKASMSNKMSQLTAERNAYLARTKSAYSNLLLDQEEIKLWDGLDLDVKQRDKARAQDLGSFEARTGASGITIGEDSAADVAAFINGQASFDEMVLRHNANNTATDILNAKARNLWEGEQLAQEIMWESATSQTAELINANMSIYGENAQAGIDIANMVDQANMGNNIGMVNAQNQAKSIIAQGQRDSNSALVKGAASMVSAYYSGGKTS